MHLACARIRLHSVQRYRTKKCANQKCGTRGIRSRVSNTAQSASHSKSSFNRSTTKAPKPPTAGLPERAQLVQLVESPRLMSIIPTRTVLRSPRLQNQLSKDRLFAHCFGGRYCPSSGFAISHRMRQWIVWQKWDGSCCVQQSSLVHAFFPILLNTESSLHRIGLVSRPPQSLFQHLHSHRIVSDGGILV